MILFLLLEKPLPYLTQQGQQDGRGGRDNEMKNEKLDKAIWSLALLCLGVVDCRNKLLDKIEDGYVSEDDPWVAAALGCSRDADIPDVALEFFIADVKAGYYDNPNPEPVASP